MYVCDIQMKGRTVLVILVTYFGGCSTNIPKLPPMICGEDNLYGEPIQEGTADIEGFPWLGLLIYPVGTSTPVKTTVVLISRQLVIAAALDIDKYPKHDFRSRARVILGHNRSEGPSIRIKDYTYHPDFMSTTYSTLALIQLDPRPFRDKVIPICPPPNGFDNAQSIYALSLDHDCDNSSMVNVYRMEYVDDTHCREFYRRIELDIETMWPTHMACARALSGGECVWTSGTALVIQDGGKWKLLGFGIIGPGCEAPARFLDYGMYHLWVKRAMSSIGQPAITRLAPNYLILRRTTSNVQRFGECDPEETQLTMYSDRTRIQPPFTFEDREGIVKYNVTLQEDMEYHCIVFRVWNTYTKDNPPEITLRRWCTNLNAICSGFSMLTIFFYVEIIFKHACTFEIVAYGTASKYVDAKALMLYLNSKKVRPQVHEASFKYQ
ncbi:uncharacterized protein LOC113502983 [Trichoplusia ni]|uniref:Uncharacterized protein LOC113502983 n=1 Tax=Trichoplusia ni TaxID=7111 RepID=A0A7E5WIG0_TRINI|nr:uncharacterized protein LOC113502983 [Trichoplusia ni]